MPLTGQNIAAHRNHNYFWMKNPPHTSSVHFHRKLPAVIYNPEMEMRTQASDIHICLTVSGSRNRKMSGFCFHFHIPRFPQMALQDDLRCIRQNTSCQAGFRWRYRVFRFLSGIPRFYLKMPRTGSYPRYNILHIPVHRLM